MSSRTFFLACSMALIGAACTGGSDELTAESSTTVVDDSAATTTTVASTVTEQESTATTSEGDLSTESAVSDEEAAAAVHARWMTEANVVNELKEGDLERYLEVVREVTTGPLLARLEERIETVGAGAELIVSPGYESNIIAIEVNGDVANVVDCSRDRSEGYDASGRLTTPADDFFKLRSARLVRIDGVWFVEDFFTGGDDRCDPDDL